MGVSHNGHVQRMLAAHSESLVKDGDPPDLTVERMVSSANNLWHDAPRPYFYTETITLWPIAKIMMWATEE